MKCEFCGQEGEPGVEIEFVRDTLRCKDAKACLEREERHYATHLRELRKRQREGDKLTGAERMELAE